MSTEDPCPDCGHATTARDLVCPLCGLLLRRAEDVAPAARGRPPLPPSPRFAGSASAPGPRRALPPPPAHGPRAVPPGPVVRLHVEDREIEPWKTTLSYLAIGLLVAPVFTFTPLLRFMGWFLASLVHETGHVAFAWLAGCPAVPAIRLDGHAAAVHGQQSVALCVVVFAGLVYAAWRLRDVRPLAIALGVTALLYPVFAFTGLKQVLFLTGGHLGELVFATIFLWRAMVGGFTPNPVERVLYASLGFYLVGQNLWLAGGLLWSGEVQAWYRTSGSFGLTNDYLRLAHDVLGTGLGTVAGGMLVVTLLAFPLAWLFAAPARRERTVHVDR